MKNEEVADQPARGLRDHHIAWCGERLQARSEVGGLTNDAALLGFNEVADDNQPGGDTDPTL